MAQAVVTIKVFFDFSNALWLTDGTLADTQSLGTVSFNGAGGFGYPADAIDSNGTLFFVGGGADNYNLWDVQTEFDGSLLPQGPVSGHTYGDIGDGLTAHDAFPSNLLGVNGWTFFDSFSIPAISIGPPTPDFGLWVTNGTFDGTELIQFHDNGLNVNVQPFGPMANVNGTVFFVGYLSPAAVAATGSATGLGYELYETNAAQTLSVDSEGDLDLTGVTTTLVKDINPGSASSLPEDLTPIGNTLFFTADDGTDGRQLWKTDGTADSSVMVTDINPGESFGQGFNPQDLFNDNGTLLFVANDGVNGTQLWKSDGSAGGTVMVTDVNAALGGILFPSGTSFMRVGGTVFFVADDGTHGEQLWKTDGSAGGTMMVTDINPGEGVGQGLRPSELTVASGTLFFAANDGTHGEQLWTSDGTAGSTVMVTDINPGEAAGEGFFPTAITAAGGDVYFYATDSLETGLWKSDGTAAGTMMLEGPTNVDPTNLTAGDGPLAYIANPSTGPQLWVWNAAQDESANVTFEVINLNGVDEPPPSGAGDITDAGGNVYFNDTDPNNGSQLWEIPSGTQEAIDISGETFNPMPPTFDPQNLTDVGGTLFFEANDSFAGGGDELWTANGFTLTLVKTIQSGVTTREFSNLTDVGGRLFFAANDGAGNELWTSDGTGPGTVMVANLNPGSSVENLSNFTDVNGELFFVDQNANGSQLWKSDGTAGGTAAVTNLNTGGGGIDPTDLVNADGTLYFAANDGTDGEQLWTSDGTAGGTVMVAPGAHALDPQDITSVNGTVFFVADDGTHGAQLWKSDGSAGGTVMVTDINPGEGAGKSFDPTGLTAINGTLYFAADDGTHGGQLWSYAGGTATMVTDINPGEGVGEGFDPTELTDSNGTLFFTANDGIHGSRLWMSDGTAAGTMIAPSAGHDQGLLLDSASDLTVFNGMMFFEADDGIHGPALWKSNGTDGGTSMVSALDPSQLTVFDGSLFFTANDGTDGTQLWTTDGTVAGTTMFTHFGAAASSPNDLTVAGSNMFFVENDGTHGYQLWKTDGTAAGTTILTNVNSSGFGLDPFNLTNVNGTLFFVGNDGTDGEQLWKSDGTASGTVMVTDVNPGTTFGDGLPAFNLTNANGTLFFTVDTGSGTQLWTSDGTGGGTQAISSFADGGPTDLVNVNGTLFFVASDGTHGLQLWKSNGTSASTVEVTTLNPGGKGEVNPDGFAPFDLVAFDGKIFFSACDGSTDQNGNAVGFNLWESDGTAAGTKRLTDLGNANVVGEAGVGSEDVDHLTVIDGVLYFIAHEADGSELWKSDGTLGGTVELGLFSGYVGNNIGLDITGLNGSVFFEAYDQRSYGTNSEYDLWKSDGTTAGTQLALPGFEGLSITAIATTVPVLSPVPAVMVAFSQNGSSLLMPNVTVSDPGSTTLTGAQISITSGRLNGDTLAAVTSNTSIIASYDPNSGVLTLSGTDTIADYQMVLQSVAYSTSNANPTSSGTDSSRGLTAVVEQGGNSSIVTSSTIDIDPAILPSNATVTSGHTLSGIEVPSGITLEVLAGGATSAITVSGFQALEQVDSGGVAHATIVLPDGDQSVDGTASGTLLSGGEEDVGNDGTASGTIVNSGGVQSVDGTAIGTIVNSGGELSAFFGTVSGTIVNNGGLLVDDEAAVDTTVNSGGTMVVDFFGSATDVTVDGGFLHLSSSSFVSDIIVLQSGGTLQVDDIVMPQAAISGFGPGDTIDLAGVGYDSGGSAVLMSGNILEVTVSGQPYDLQLASSDSFAGEKFVTSFDNVSGTNVTVVPAGPVVSSGTTQYVAGASSNTTVDGTQVLFGSAVSTTIDSGGTQEVAAGGSASGTTVSSGGTQYDAGTASGTTLSGGSQVVFGSAASTTVANGGTLDVAAGGTANGTVVSSGGTAYDAGTASGTTLSSGTEVVFGSTVGTTIDSGGAQQVVAGGITSDTTVSSGGIQYDAGTATSTTLSGGTQVVFGSATSTTIDSGGIQSIAAGGTASGTTVSAGGIQYDAGTAIGTILSGGGQAVYGSAASTTIDSGGYEVALSGGIIGGATISGGTLELQSGSTAGSSTITFAGGGTLKLDATGAYGFLVAGFAVPDAFDFSLIDIASATSGYSGDTSSGTLTVSDGTHSASIVLLGNYKAAGFNLGPESGGGTGTVVTYVPPADGDASQLTTPPHG